VSSLSVLAALAAMLDDEALPIKCVSLSAVGSYDTHSDEVDTLSSNLGQTVESVVAFQRDLEARGLDKRVLVQRVVGVRPSPRAKTAQAPITAQPGWPFDRLAREGRNGR